jgi:hypothetical protein
MTTHLTAEQMRNYSVRRVTVIELGKLTEHLHGCRRCYEAYLTVLQRRFPIEIDFEELGGLKGWHLQGRQLTEYVEARMSELDFDYASLHLRECPDCDRRVNDALRDWLDHTPSNKLTTFADSSTSQRMYLPGFFSNASPLARVAAALVLVISFALILWAIVGVRSQQPKIAVTPGAEEHSSERDIAKEESLIKPSDPIVGSKSAHPPNTIATAQPNSPSHIGGAKAAEPKTNIEAELIAKDLRMPRAIEIFDKSPEPTVRGTAAHVESFAVLIPFSTLTRDEQPTFAWSPLTGATSYTVSVYDSRMRLVLTSEPVTDTHWSIPARLQRGAVYTWIVAAARNGETVMAPALPTRAEFKIIAKSELVKIRRKLEGIKSHAARAVICAEEGLLDDAEREFRTYLALNPDDDRVKELLNTIESWRRLRSFVSETPTVNTRTKQNRFPHS